MKITLRQLAIFDAVARTGSVSQAARDIALTQSAASMGLRDLERQLGCALFHRRHRQLLLNEHGRRLQPKAHALLVGAGDIEMIGADTAHRGPLTIGASTYVGSYLLPGLCAAFLAAHPQVQFQLDIRPTLEIMARVDAMQLDLAFIEAPSHRPGHRTVPWRVDQLVIFAAPSHPLAQRGRLQPIDLKDASWCLQPRSSALRMMLMVPILKHLPAVRPVFEATSIEAIKGAVRSGAGIGCLCRHAIADELRAGLLVALPVSGLDLSIPLNIISCRDVPLADAHEAFVRMALAWQPA